MTYSYNEFHISKTVRDECKFSDGLFASSGNVVLQNIRAVRDFQARFNQYLINHNKVQISAGTLNAMGLLDEIFHLACYTYRRQKYQDSFKGLLSELEGKFGKQSIRSMILDFCAEFPPTEVYKGHISIDDYLNLELTEKKTGRTRTNWEQTLEEMLMLHLDNENPAFKPFIDLFDDSSLRKNPKWKEVWTEIQSYFKKLPYWGTFGHDLISFLREPVNFAPDNIQEQLNYVRVHWADLLIPGEGEGEDYWLKRLLSGSDLLSEEWKPAWHPTNGGSPDMSPPNYDYLMREYERFSADKEWMPRVVLMAKTVLVWLYQLSKKYGREINRLDQIPDEELDLLRDEGFTGLWLIGLWERSQASRTIKQICGNPEAAASAYSLDDYEIAWNLGGWDALSNLRTRLWQRGIRLASDMVPNHTGMDARWVVEKPDLFVQRRDNPFPQYTYNGVNLSHDSRVAIYLEDHYYSKNDCAVCFKRVDTTTGETRYIYHGNDGTGMPWNDTAQIDFLNPVAREEVMQKILHVARNFPIIRFDAAMVLAKKHIKRLWYPEPGKGGDIATRSEFALSAQEFENRIPNEFWREVVDRVAKEVPDTLLLAEAFWMMEGYFTRTLGMHRVYNSAFMNMLKKEENYKYRQTVKNTINFDPQILKRYVNFMNNPDEETAVAQFGKGDKYFGVCTLMATMPGLPMFGHGQIEGFEEKYGMEYTRAYRDEVPDQYLVDRHKREIFPLLKKRYLFAGVEDFLFYDVWDNGSVNENVFAYSNRCGSEYSVVFYNNKYERASGWIKQSCEYAVKTGSGENDKKLVTRSISEGLGLWGEDDFYMIFREDRSNLWYIRKSKDICEQGMFISLNGFETQIFMDIRQEKDKDGSLKELCDFLNGKGTPDLHTAWQELHYKKLYQAFQNLIGNELCLSLGSLKMNAKELKEAGLKKATSASVKKIISSPLEYFYSVANEFAEVEFNEEQKAICEKKKAELKTWYDGELGKLKSDADAHAPKEQTSIISNYANDTKCRIDAEAVSEKGSSSKTKEVASKAKKSSSADDTAKKEKALKAEYEKKLSTIEKSVVTFKAFAAPKSLAFPKAGKITNEDIYLYLYSALAPLAQSGFARKWSLERKLAEFTGNTKIGDMGSYGFFQRVFALSEGEQPALTEKSAKEDLLLIAKKLAKSELAWLYVGANEYDGIKWFNKEKMESTLELYETILSLNAGETKAKLIASLFKKLNSAQEKADYKCEEFVKAFEKR
ncbi:alpha-amylase family glycosyl hydrolase [Treponema sp.]|uniref:alpha-amylase family glycosyl hydrolase n=1 Tax=Treponema sp. TaxID=166 RepID=UPI0025DAE414|nr:alpha-amylase family glycosyl hydrolase [Treponema sp.]MBR4323683.1 alpha-amylase [Treponema sp.]